MSSGTKTNSLKISSLTWECILLLHKCNSIMLLITLLKCKASWWKLRDIRWCRDNSKTKPTLGNTNSKMLTERYRSFNIATTSLSRQWTKCSRNTTLSSTSRRTTILSMKSTTLKFCNSKLRLAFTLLKSSTSRTANLSKRPSRLRVKSGKTNTKS